MDIAPTLTASVSTCDGVQEPLAYSQNSQSLGSPKRQSRFSSWAHQHPTRGAADRQRIFHRSGSRHGMDPNSANFTPVGRRDQSSGNFQQSMHRSNSRPRSRDRSQGKTCHYCRKPGHIMKDCRRRLGLCFMCGSDDHRVAACPDMAMVDGDGSNNNTNAGTGANNRGMNQQLQTQRGRPAVLAQARTSRSPGRQVGHPESRYSSGNC